jgi:hypothetical protein
MVITVLRKKAQARGRIERKTDQGNRSVGR